MSFAAPSLNAARLGSPFGGGGGAGGLDGSPGCSSTRPLPPLPSESSFLNAHAELMTEAEEEALEAELQVRCALPPVRALPSLPSPALSDL